MWGGQGCFHCALPRWGCKCGARVSWIHVVQSGPQQPPPAQEQGLELVHTKLLQHSCLVGKRQLLTGMNGGSVGEGGAVLDSR